MNYSENKNKNKNKNSIQRGWSFWQFWQAVVKPTAIAMMRVPGCQIILLA